jgi:hypothetical protein
VHCPGRLGSAVPARAAARAPGRRPPARGSRRDRLTAVPRWGHRCAAVGPQGWVGLRRPRSGPGRARGPVRRAPQGISTHRRLRRRRAATARPGPARTAAAAQSTPSCIWKHALMIAGFAEP